MDKFCIGRGKGPRAVIEVAGNELPADSDTDEVSSRASDLADEAALQSGLFAITAESSGATEDSVARGLENSFGSNHCFLNAVIQAFWNLRTFRTRFLAAADHSHRPKAIEDSCCYCKLKGLFSEYKFSEEETLPPDSLRIALSHIYRSEGRFQLGEMEDATETFEALLDIFHASSVRAFEELAGSPTDSASLTPVASEQLCGSCSTGSTGGGGGGGRSGGGEEGGGSQPSAGGGHNCRRRKSVPELVHEASYFPCQPLCLAHEVFGIEYVDLWRCSFCDSCSEPLVTGSFLLPVYVAELLEPTGLAGLDLFSPRGPTGGLGVGDGHGRRLSGASAPPALGGGGGGFGGGRGTLANHLGSMHRRLVPTEKCPECNSLRTMSFERWLTRRPHTLVLSLVWPDTEPSMRSLFDLLSALSPFLSTEKMFMTQTRRPSSPSVRRSSAPPGPGLPRPWMNYAVDETYAFCGMICYHGMHYVAIFWCWSKMTWTVFNDTSVHQEPDWSSVVSLAVRSSYVPTLLFHERISDDAVAPPSPPSPPPPPPFDDGTGGPAGGAGASAAAAAAPAAAAAAAAAGPGAATAMAGSLAELARQMEGDLRWQAAIGGCSAM